MPKRPQLRGGRERAWAGRSWLRLVLPTTLALAVFWVAYDAGSYAEPDRHALAICAWWLVVLGLALGLWPLADVPRAAVAAGALLAAFAALALISAAWAPSVEAAIDEMNRVTLYLGVFLLAVVASSRANVTQWSDGVALGLVGVAIIALVSRMFPGSFPDPGFDEILPSARMRLSFPLGYWNGLAILVGLGVPLLLRAAVAARDAVSRGAAVAALPAVAAVLFLASSRGGFATALVAAVVFLVLSGRPWAVAAALAAGGAASLALVWFLTRQDALVEGPFTTGAATDEGREAAAVAVGLCFAAGSAYALGAAVLSHRLRPSPLTGRVVAATAAAAAVVAVAAVDVRAQFATFKRPPSELARPTGDFVRAHLLSGGGSGRWQFWTAAVDAFETAPIFGRGAGSYEAWWAQHGSLATFVRDAHSLYLEVLGELGAVGFALLAAAFALVLVAGVRRARSQRADEGETAAALTAAFAAYAVAAAIDWMWETTVVTVVAMVCAGLVVGPATRPAVRPRAARADDRRRPPRFALGIATLAVGWVVICAHAIPLLAALELRASQDAAAAGDSAAAVRNAETARDIEPWSAAPYLQLALLEEEAGQLARARRSIRRAIERDASDWRLWLVAARIATKSGAIADARHDLARASALNPRSPLFQPPR